MFCRFLLTLNKNIIFDFIRKVFRVFGPTANNVFHRRLQQEYYLKVNPSKVKSYNLAGLYF